jgi:(p)ppGpp synthase/HD superfamily hydrolase
MDFETAVGIAAHGHHGQKDKEGVVYLLHPLRVALVVSPEARNVGVLHDVLEDTNQTRQSLEEAGLTDEELDAVELLTRRDDETYEQYIERIVVANGRAGELAREVKLADVRDKLGRMPASDAPAWVERHERYEKAIARLSATVPQERLAEVSASIAAPGAKAGTTDAHLAEGRRERS